MMNLTFLEQTFLNNTVADYRLATAIAVLGIVAANLIRAIVAHRLRHWAQLTKTPLEPILIRLSAGALGPLLYLGAVYVAVGNLNLHPILDRTVDAAALAIATVLGIRWLNALLEAVLRTYLLRGDRPHLEQAFKALLPAFRIAVWAIGAVFLLDNLGFNISAVVASLGLGGLALALAAQGILADLFSYVSILLDRPFEIGDFISSSDFVGTVSRIGIKTTRLTSLSGEELVVVNTEITSSRLRNFKQMQRRRVSFQLGIIYETPAEKLSKIPEIIARIIEDLEGVSFDRAHLASYGDFSLNYEVVYYVESSDYLLHMDLQQQIYLALFRTFAEQNIEFAYPTQVTILNPHQATA